MPNGILFGDGVGARITKQLLTECNLHTVVRLPDGVFEPYTAIPSNLLFFDKTGRTMEVWFYEVAPPEGRKKYSKTKPMRFEELVDCQIWWSDRSENDRAWRVPIADLEANGFNLDLRNPNRPDDLAHRPPSELVVELINIEREILSVLEGPQQRYTGHEIRGVAERPLSDVMDIDLDLVDVDPQMLYNVAGVYGFGRGVFARAPISGSETSYRQLNRLHADRLVMSRLKAFQGAVSVVPEQFDGWYLSPEFPTFRCREGALDPGYLGVLCRWPEFWSRLSQASAGIGARRERVHPEALGAISIPVPPIDEQRRIASRLGTIKRIEDLHTTARARIEALLPAALNEAFSHLR